MKYIQLMSNNKLLAFIEVCLSNITDTYYFFCFKFEETNYKVMATRSH